MDGGRLHTVRHPAIPSADASESVEQGHDLSQLQSGNANSAAASERSASASSSPARSAQASPVPQIPRHRLGGPIVPRPDLERALADSPFSMPSRAELHAEEHHRQLADGANESESLVRETAFTLTGEQACALLGRPNAPGTLRALRLRDCSDADLVNLARVSSSAPGPSFELVLDKHAGVRLSAIGFRALAAVPLSGITLNELAIPREFAEYLSRSVSPLSINLSSRIDGQSEVYWLSQIPTLKSLSVGGHYVSSAASAALASHPLLAELGFSRVSGAVLGSLLANPRLRTLSTDAIVGNEAYAFAALANHPGLTALRIGRVSEPEHLVALSRNTSLLTLNLDLSAAARSGMRDLARISTLTSLSLSVSGEDGMLTLADVQRLCARTYADLRFTMVEIEPAALMHIVATQTQRLVLDYCFYITDQAVDALVANARITELSVIGCVNERQALALASKPSLTKLAIDFASDSVNEAEAQIKRTWVAAGKLLANLDLTVLGDEEDDYDDATIL